VKKSKKSITRTLWHKENKRTTL